MILFGRYGHPYGRAGDQCRIRETQEEEEEEETLLIYTAQGSPFRCKKAVCYQWEPWATMHKNHTKHINITLIQVIIKIENYFQLKD